MQKIVYMIDLILYDMKQNRLQSSDRKTDIRKETQS